MTWLSFTLYGISIPVMFNIVQRRPFLFKISAKHTVVVFYSTLLPQKCTKLNIEKQNAQGHLGSNLTPGRENRNFRKTVITNSTKPLCGPRGNLWQSHEGLCHCKIHKKSYRKKKRRLGSNLTPGGLLRVNEVPLSNIEIHIQDILTEVSVVNLSPQVTLK